MKKLRRKPTYGAAIRLARIAAGLFSKPYGWSFKSIAESLQISERTLARYVSVLRGDLLDWHGGPLVEVVGTGTERKLRLVSSMKAAEASSYQVALLYFSLTVLKFLEGTVLKEGVEGLWEKVYRNLSLTQQTRLSDLERKFYAVPYAPKDYTDFSEQLDVILRALLDQSRLKVDYAGLTGEGHQHDFDPYSLIAYRGGLYLIGHSHRRNAIIYLAVERIRTVEFIREPDGTPTRFIFPRGFDPAAHTEGTFGIVDGPETKVELKIHSEQTEAYVRSRTIHRSQRFARRRDGTTLMTMTVKGTTELANWIMSMGPWIEVLKPAALRKEIAQRHAKAARLYRVG
ncbi:MAG TPA: WYL domain-containing protein [Candidatus Binataceae bacterium]|jgi:proteasome accessory factor B|nr:WYL domain-containing protein [Candidatus Binataceae bacterium]